MSLLNIASSGLTAAQGTLSTISHNIANANTAGFSRQETVLETAGGLYTGAGFFGRGVEQVSVRRHYDAFLTTAVQSAGSVQAADSARADGLRALDAVFGDSELGLGASMDALFSAAGDLAARPADAAARQVFLARAAQWAERVRSVGGQIAGLRSGADARLGTEAQQVNAHLADVQRLNAQIAQSHGSGQPPNDLLDQRDAAVAALGQRLAVRTVAQDDGTLALFLPSGAPLLVGNQVSRLEAAPDPADPARTALRLHMGTTSQWLDAAALGGGSLAGTLRLRDEDLAAALHQVGQIARALATAVNQQQGLGVDMDGAAGAAIFRLADPVVRPNAVNTGGATFTATVADATALQASDYELAWSGSAWTVTRLADGAERNVTALPLDWDGLRFQAGAGAAAGDRWRVQPHDAVATGLATRPVSARQVATAYAATVQAGVGNTGGAAASGFTIHRVLAANTEAVTLQFNDPPTSFNVTGPGGAIATNVPYTSGARVPAAPADYNGWSLVLDGTPAAGDRFDVGPVPQPGADNRNALALQGLGRAALVGGARVGEGYATLLADVGARVQGGVQAAEVSRHLASEAASRQQAVAGVNLDEEAANLLRYQQAYQACARVIQASQSLFDSLLAATGR